MNRINYLLDIYGNKLSYLLFHPKRLFQEFKRSYLQIRKAKSILASAQQGECRIRIFPSTDLDRPRFIADKESVIIFSSVDTVRFLVNRIYAGKRITHDLPEWLPPFSTVSLGGRGSWLELLELLSGGIEGSSEWDGQRFASLLLFYIRADRASHARENWEYYYVNGDEEEFFYKIYCPKCEQHYQGVELKTKMHKDMDYQHSSHDVDGILSEGGQRHGLDISCPKDHKICFAVES